MFRRPAMFRSLMRQTAGRFFAYASAAAGPVIVGRNRIEGLDQVFSIHPTSRLNAASADATRISLGRGVYIGEHVEVTTYGGGGIEIDNDTSLQSFCVVYGDVAIGAHCTFARHVLVTSTNHRFKDRSAWLIRDQDRLPFEPSTVRIEEDCWLGWSAVVLPGVYVGRGAVIGANCVVSRDVPPYEVHGGAPHRRISKRLTFAPRPNIDANDNDCLPYFYRGFLLSQDALKSSRMLNCIEARRRACIVLAGANSGSVRLRGVRIGNTPELQLRLRVNGSKCGVYNVATGIFEITATISTANENLDRATVPGALGRFTYVEIESSVSRDQPGYGICSASLN
jgi:acetyltransferase-like isoleucine patch superfamily enzyme